MNDSYLELSSRKLGGDLDFAIDLAMNAGQIMMDYYNSDLMVKLKNDRSIVTNADLAVSDYIGSRINKFYQNYAHLDEESGDDGTRFSKNFCWVTDPLDSTRDFTEKKDGFSVIIGLLYKFQPVLGVTYRPQVDELAYATLGGGAYLINNSDKKELKVSKNPDIQLIHSERRCNHDLEEMIQIVKPATRKTMGGFSKVVEVAKGENNLFLSPPSNKFNLWDICGTSIILSEAGGILTDVYGKDIDFSQRNVDYHNGVIAASARVHQGVFNLLNE